MKTRGLGIPYCVRNDKLKKTRFSQQELDNKNRTLAYTYIIHLPISSKILQLTNIIHVLNYICSLPVVVEPSKASAEPAWQISGFFMPILALSLFDLL